MIDRVSTCGTALATRSSKSSGALLQSVGKVCPARGVKAAVVLGGSADGGLKGPRAAIKSLEAAD